MSGIEAGKAYVKFLLEDSELKKSLRNVGRQLQSIGKIGLTATAPLIGGFTAAVAAALKFGDAVGDMSARTGITVEALSALKFAAEQSDASVGSLEKAVQRMTLNLGNAANGTGTFQQTLQSLGVGLSELQSLTPDQQFLRLADALAAIEDPALRAALAQKTFGKASGELLPLLTQGKAGIESLMKTATDFGVTLTTEDVTALGELDVALKAAIAQVVGLAIQIGVAVSKPLKAFLVWTQETGVWLIQLAKEHQAVTAVVAIASAAIAALSAGLIALGVAIQGVTFAIAAAKTAMIAFGAVMTFLSAHPIIAALIAIAAAVAAIAAYFGDASEAADDFKTSLDGVAKDQGISTPSTPDLDALTQEAAMMQKRADAATAALAASGPAINPVASFDSQVFEKMNEGIRALVEIQQRTYQHLLRSRGGFFAGTD